jgi:hypothetical protein
MEKPLEEKDTLSQDGIIGTSDVELEDTFVWLMSTITFYIAMRILFLLCTNKSFPSQEVITDISYCLLKNKIITH